MTLSRTTKTRAALACLLVAAAALSSCHRGPVSVRGLGPSVSAEEALDGMAKRDAELQTISLWGVITYTSESGRGFANFVAHIDRRSAYRLELSDPFYLPVLIVVVAGEQMQVLDLRSNELYVGRAEPDLMERLAGVRLDPKLLVPALTGRLRFSDGRPEVALGSTGLLTFRQAEINGLTDPAWFLLTNFRAPMYEEGDPRGRIEVKLSDVNSFEGLPLATQIICRSIVDDADDAERFIIGMTIEEATVNPAFTPDIFVLSPAEGTVIREGQDPPRR